MKQIEIIARALVVNDGKVLLCENKKSKHYFLPGGHVEFGESLKAGLSREIEEEMGISGVVGDLVGVLENTFQISGDTNFEINIIFSTTLDTNELASQEEHIAFHWVESDSLSDLNLLPKKLPNLIKKWMENKETFFESNF
jgi:8-oxo-dGTP diphosphatase